MGASKKRRVKALEPHLETDASRDCYEIEKSRKRSVRQQFHEAAGKTVKHVHSSPSGSAEALSSSFETRTTNFVEEITKLPALYLNTGERLHPSSKVKLQLFPIDESTRLGLEKGGFHPYLELTLSARKKISSVLKHLDSKWGSSTIALGEPVLFPYSVAENLASYRWTRNDINISAMDVYATIGSPAVFRLRYGWMSDLETKNLEQPSASALFKPSSKLEDVQKVCNTHMQSIYGRGEETEVTREESEKPITMSAETNAVNADKMPPNEAVDSMDNEVRVDSSIGQSLAMWADSLTNISIGGLLSEASLQGKFGNCDPKSNGRTTGLQSSQLISDSFDAFLAGQMNLSQNPTPPPQVTHSSILDADDTCHGFPFQKFPCLGKDATASGGSAYAHSGSKDTGSKSFKHHNQMKANNQSQGQPCQQSDTDLMLCSRIYNDESSLELSGIKWTESLGPWPIFFPQNY
ncbi:hypothetical protein PTKIN_Ptkin07bG0085600 [Pterospermum kingtungense]